LPDQQDRRRHDACGQQGIFEILDPVYDAVQPARTFDSFPLGLLAGGLTQPDLF
jgi:hypothetical protein